MTPLKINLHELYGYFYREVVGGSKRISGYRRQFYLVVAKFTDWSNFVRQACYFSRMTLLPICSRG